MLEIRQNTLWYDSAARLSSPEMREIMDNREFGKRLMLARREAGLTQIALRDKIKDLLDYTVGQNYISQIEKGDAKKRPSFEVVQAIAITLNISLDYLGLLINDALPPVRQETEPNYISPEADETAKMIDTLPQERRPEALALVRSFLEPLSERQRVREELRATLQSIEIDFGTDTRQKIERTMRSNGLPVSTGSQS